MKILITSDWYYPVVNGVVRSILNLKKYMEDQGHEVRVLTLSNSTESYESDGVYYIGSVGAGKVYPDARITATFRNKFILEIIKWSPDVIHSQCEFSTFMMARKIAHKTNAPLIHTYHTVYEDYTHYFSPSRRWGKKVISVLSRAVAERVSKIVAPSEKTKNILLGYGIGEDIIEVIPTGIEIPELMSKDKLRQLHGYSKDDNIMLYLGRIAAEKNIEEILDFYEKIEMDNLKLLVVGGGPYLEKLKSYSNKLSKNVEFLGMIEPVFVKEYYQLADIFVSASQSETQGLTYYEALSNSTIAICRKDSCLEGVIIDGFNGYQYTKYEDFSKDLLEVLNDKEKKLLMQKNARNYAEENFSIKSFGRKCEKEYYRLVDEKVLA